MFIILYPSFDFAARNSQNLHCFAIPHIKQRYIISNVTVATSNPGLMALYIRRDLMRNELVGVCRVRCVCASEVH